MPEPDDVAALADELAAVLARPGSAIEPDGNERGRKLERRFRRLVEAGVGLSDEYADDID